MIGKTNLSGGENVTPEVTAQTPIIENIMTSLEGKVWEDKKGLYAWKKYDISPNTPLEITAIQQTATFVNYVGYLPFVLDSTNVDLSTVSINYFFNMIFQTTSISSEPYTIKDNGFGRAVAISGSRTYDVTWDAPTKTLTFSRGDTNFGDDIRTWTVTTNKVLESTFLGYVVSDKENSYPDGDTQGGYWYEKVVEGTDLVQSFGYTKYAIDKFTLSSEIAVKYETCYINHSLREKPSFAFLTSVGVKTDYRVTGGISKMLTGKTYSTKRGFYLSDSQEIEESLYGLSILDATRVSYNSGNTTYMAKGVEYTLITMA